MYYFICRRGKFVSYITARQRRRRIAAQLLQIEEELNLSQHSDSDSSLTSSNIPLNLNLSVIASEVLDDSCSSSFLPNSLSFNITTVPHDTNVNSSTHMVVIDKEKVSFKDFLKNWAVQENICASSLNKLLYGFNTYGLNNVTYGLPLDSRTLLNTPKSTIVKQVEPGFYTHLGIEPGVLKYLKENSNGSSNDLQILINIDGLPVTKSGSSELWPILGSIYKSNYVFLIGLYHGCQKPSDIFAFLEDFVKEASVLINMGITYQDKIYSFSIKGFCADSPAKALILNVKYHTGYSSCTKCDVIGDYSERRVCFTNYIGRKRTDKSFTDHVDEDYHQGRSPLESISGLGLVSQVPLDYQHLVCLGVMKKMLLIWNFGKFEIRRRGIKLSYRETKLISRSLENLVKNHVPIEFQRKPRSLNYVKKWKATEYRQLLLYSGPIVLKNILTDKVYDNFITLHMAISLLCSKRYCSQQVWLSYAKNLLECFVKQFEVIYGKHNISFNVHGLLHLADDVENFGMLDYFSTFRFECFLGHLKKKLRKEEKPLQQIVRRYSESITLNYVDKSCYKSDIKITDDMFLSNKHVNGPLLEGCTNPQYGKLKLTDMTLIVNDKKNDCCCVKGDEIIKIYNIAFNTFYNTFVVIGRKYLKKYDIYKLPCPSSTIGIYEVCDLSEFKIWDIKNIQFKYFSYPVSERSARMAVVPLHHTE